MASCIVKESNDITQTDAAISLSGDTDEYRMRHADRGYALIINNKTFPQNKAPTREGTEEDAREMQNLLRTLNFQDKNITTVSDATELDMMNILKEAAARNYTECDCFVCIILTHGDEGVVMSSDGKVIPIDQLTAQMRKDKCPTLAEKPKIFIIQACNGAGLDLGVTLTLTQHDSTIPDEADVVTDEMPKKELKKSEPDFLIAHSSVPGYYAWLHPRTGSLFIQSLVDVISKHWRQQDLLSMLTEVNSRVAFDTEFKMNSLKQMPFFQSLLTKKVFFHTN